MANTIMYDDTIRYENQTIPVRVTRDAAQSLNFTLKVMDAQEWSLRSDFKIAENVDTQSFTEISERNLRGFNVDNYDIVDYQPANGVHHLLMTDQV